MAENALPPESQLPYAEWTEEALRHVVVRALEHAAQHGLPGEHHYYVTFRTDYPGVLIPPRLKTQYPQEMTIVLQHQFWDLKVDEEADMFSVGLSFGGVPAVLAIPLAAITGFSDPLIRYTLRFSAPEALPEDELGDGELTEDEVKIAAGGTPAEEAPQIVSLDAFRKRTAPPKE